MEDMLKIIKEEFDRLFGDSKDARLFFSPGRVNIIGEHIDYNGGLVMPCSIDRGTYFIVRKNKSKKVRAYSIQFENLGLKEFKVGDLNRENLWTDYVKGCMSIFNINFCIFVSDPKFIVYVSN